jgi:hypothetical protein
MEHYSGGGGRKSTTFGESTSGKSSDFWVWSLEMVQRHGGYTYEQGELRGRVGEERRGKEMDGCPLTLLMTKFNLFQ